MSPPNVKPRLISFCHQTTSKQHQYRAISEDARFAAMIQDYQRQRQMLTPRELEVLALLCEGLPNKLIERRLGIGAGTVKCHVANILSKLGVASRLQAVVEAHKRGLIGNDAGGAPQGDDLGDDSGLRDAPLNGTRRFGSMGRLGD